MYKFYIKQSTSKYTYIKTYPIIIHDVFIYAYLIRYLYGCNTPPHIVIDIQICMMDMHYLYTLLLILARQI